MTGFTNCVSIWTLSMLDQYVSGQINVCIVNWEGDLIISYYKVLSLWSQNRIEKLIHNGSIYWYVLLLCMSQEPHSRCQYWLNGGLGSMAFRQGRCGIHGSFPWFISFSRVFKKPYLLKSVLTYKLRSICVTGTDMNSEGRSLKSNVDKK